MEKLIETITNAVAADATDETRAAGAQLAARSLLRSRRHKASR